MDAYPLAFSGCLFVTGGLITLVLTTYASLAFSIFILTEALSAFLVTLFGICLLRKSMKKVEASVAEIEQETEPSGRLSPFYYELEPIIQKRDLPPVPRDIGRDYNPIVTDKV